MQKDYILITLKQLFPKLKDKYSVKKIGLFGSFANDKATSKSDIDIYVEFQNKNFDNVTGCWNYLEEVFHKKIDLIYPHKYSKNIENIKNKVIYG